MLKGERPIIPQGQKLTKFWGGCAPPHPCIRSSPRHIRLCGEPSVVMQLEAAAEPSGAEHSPCISWQTWKEPPPGAIFPAVDDVVPAALHATDTVRTERDPTLKKPPNASSSNSLKVFQKQVLHHGGNPISLQQSHCNVSILQMGTLRTQLGKKLAQSILESLTPGDFPHPSSVLSESPIRRTSNILLDRTGTTCTPTYTVSKHGSWSHLSGSSHTPRLRG